jgi:hypothetical protein
MTSLYGCTIRPICVCSSYVSTSRFHARGLVDYRLGILPASVTFAGALIGGRVALRLSNAWLRRIFLTAVVALALETLFYDLFQHN